MALNVKRKYPGTQGGAAQLYASDTRLSLRRREQVFTRLSKSYKENMDISSTRSSSDEEIIVLLNEERRRRRQCRRYSAYIFFVVTYVCSARLFCVWAPPSCVLCNFSCSRHVSKSANLIGRIVFDAARQTKKTNQRRFFLFKWRFYAWRFSRRCAHSHWRTLFSHEALTVGEYRAEGQSKQPGLHYTWAVPQTDHLHATPHWCSNSCKRRPNQILSA